MTLHDLAEYATVDAQIRAKAEAVASSGHPSEFSRVLARMVVDGNLSLLESTLRARLDRDYAWVERYEMEP